MKPERLLIIDDDPTHNFLMEIAISRIKKEIPVKSFTEPETGLEFIQNQYPGKDHSKTVLLLDLNMPGMSGWEFLNRFGEFPDKIKSQFDIYIVSSSIDPRDKDRAGANPMVKEYLEKPLQKETIRSIID
jgi:CheY-like chemotaxis protein